MNGWSCSSRQNDYVVFYTVPCSREAQTDNILSVADAIRVMFIGLLVSMQEKRQKELEKMPIRKLKPLLRDCGLSVEGKKTDLVERLMHRELVSDASRRAGAFSATCMFSHCYIA